ncbi:hypothetical protein KFE25_010631 [Diacronema lutheri]|uniref:Alkaline phosphatase n=1 Tax=Diacronema lutheri TaxID=2081491 RepID=A0A7R9UNV1_DIALT|nr:hypothetical protein KFE25_010631 [Diacronema lutheri]
MLRLSFALCLGGAAALSVEQGLYPGRVGDVVFTTAHKAEEAAHLVLLGAGKEAGPSSMPETSVAPLAAHIAGSLATAFPSQVPEVAPRVAAPASALLTLAVEGLTMADLAEYPRLAQLVGDGHAIRLEPTFEPRDRVSAAVSRATGMTPADHGIAAKAWLDAASSELVAAYSAGRDETAARVATVTDVVAQSSAGRALILSLSSDAQLAAAGGLHPSLLRTAAAAAWPTAVVSYDADSRALKPTQLGAVLPQPLFTVTVEEALASLAAIAPAEAAQLDVTQPLIAALVAEVGGALVILQRIAADPALAALVADRQPDVLAISIAALAPLRADAAAMRALDAALPKLVDAFSSAWGSKARAQLVLAPADADARVAPVDGWTVVGSHAFASDAAHAAKVDGCAKFALALEGSSITAHCVAASRAHRRLQEETAQMPPTTFTSDQLELYQVTLWSSILLIVTLLAGSCALYNMEVTQDSLLFSKGKDA